ncbi:DNA translocase FtsK [Chlamydia trachomatis L2b/Canada1]|uniref:FtsK/SpoIIIE family DNA translocase n=1 Tax=Chlamydia trachomatis TaxID=813 RepID=UPI0002AA2DDF|nr:DNA translocase FtsK [Chlamydia trachomatis]CCP92630.1 DNA translocase FtsK [Chlamydia trachomatis L2b/Canada1]
MGKERKKASVSLSPQTVFAVKTCVYLALACFSGLSLWSFQHNQPYTQNWIGLLGWSLSSFLLYNFGVAAFLIPLNFGWLSFLNMKRTPAPLAFRKAAAFGAIPVCCAVLLSMISPAQNLPQFLATRVPMVVMDLQPPKAYLGGIPFYLLYDGNSFSLKLLIGAVGTGLIFLAILLCAIFYLKKKALLDDLLKFLKNKFYACWNACKKLLKNLVNNKSYVPEPSLRVPSSPSVAKKEMLKLPTPVISLPLENKDLHDDSSVNRTIFLTPPHPTKRTLSPQKRTDLPNLLPKDSASAPAQTSYKPLPTPSPFVLAGDAPDLPQYHLLSKRNVRRPESLLEELKKKAAILQQTLASFGIEAAIGNICSGPTLAAFEVLPNTGVKVQKIKALENDIALNLQASSIRIIAPIPGKAAVGIEIPNPDPQPVNFRDLLEDYQKGTQRLQVPLLLGRKANGDNFWTDLATMPHLIIAGTTGSGKSVCINTIVMSLIMTSPPTDIKLVIVDPKKVELTGYSQLPHMLTPVITESKEAHSALIWLVREMELRYEILRFLGLRNIQSFNSRTRNVDIEASYDKEIPEKMPFIVGIIDELSDLLLSSSHDIETPIVRLAQMARAVGIHLILATQRPSRDVITGLIKANFPSRIAFKVANKVNSQIIIDEPGAENLMGNGDMLVVSPGSFAPVRVQGAYICDDDINKVIKDLCSRFPCKYVIPSFNTYDDPGSMDPEDLDPLFNQAKTLVLQTGNASTTFLQRKLKIGYARAASIIDQLEEARIVGPSEGAKPRQILVQLSNQDD